MNLCIKNHFEFTVGFVQTIIRKDVGPRAKTASYLGWLFKSSGEEYDT